MSKLFGKKLVSLAIVVTMILSLVPCVTLAKATFEVTSVTFNKGINGVSAVTEAVVEFSEAVDENTINGNVVVSGGVNVTAKKLNDTSYTLSFDNAFDYETAYTLTFGSGISAISGATLVEKTETFTTEPDPINTLYYENFDGDAATALSRFTQVSQWMEDSEGLEVSDGWLKIICRDTDYHQRPIYKINGSDSWKDFEMEWDSKIPGDDTRQSVVLGRMQGNEGTGYEASSWQNGWLDSMGASLGIKYSFWDGATAIGETTGALSYRSDFPFTYHNKLSMVGNALSFTVTSNGEVLSINANDTTYAEGSIGITGQELLAYFDNIVITDKNEFTFAPDTRKLNGSDITLTFTKNITTDANAIKNAITVTDAQGNAIVTNAVAEGSNAVKITLNDAKANTVYRVTVNTGLTGADNSQVLSAAKTFEVRTATGSAFGAEAPTIVSVTPASGSIIDTIDDIILTFSKEMNVTTLKDYITINGGADSFTVSHLGGTEYKIIPTSLPYNSTVTVVLGEGIKSEDGGNLATQTLTYNTKPDPINTLYYENFDGDAATALSRFTQVSQWMEDSEGLEVSDGWLKIICRDTDYHQRPIYKINGSDSWKDFEMEWDSKIPGDDTRQSVVLGRMQGNEGTGYEASSWQNGWLDSMGASLGIKYSFWDGATAIGETTGALSYRSDFPFTYHNKLSMVGNALSFTVTSNGEVLSINANDTTYAEGSIGITGQELLAYFDNIVITDKNEFTFAPDTRKLNGSDITLTFTKNITTDANAIKNAITVTDAQGNPVNVTVTPVGTNKVKITLSNPSENTNYNVSVATSLVGANSEVMSNAKSFVVRTTTGSGFGAQPPVINAITPADNTTGVNVLDDIIVTFSKKMNENTIAQNVTINNGTIDFKVVKLSDISYKIAPKSALPYNTEIVVELGSGIKSADNGNFSAQTIKFTTERDTINTLFFEDFNGNASNALARFTQIGTVTSNMTWGIENGRMKLYTSDGFDENGAWSDYAYYGTPVMKINGSDNWSDYQVEFDIPNEGGTVSAYVQSRINGNDGTNTGYRAGMNINSWYISQGQGGFDARITKVSNLYTEEILSTEGMDYETKPIHITFTAVGSDLSVTAKMGNVEKTVNTVDTTYTSGGIGLAGDEAYAYFDNVLVIDKGVTFTVDKTKYVSGNVSLAFTSPIDPDTLDGAFIVTDNTGKTVSSIATLADANTVNVSIPNYENNTRYTIKVADGLKTIGKASVAGGKYVQILTDTAIEIAALYLANSDGAQLTTIGDTASVKAVASIVNYEEDQDVELVLAVYDNNGHIYKVETTKYVVENGDSTIISTAEITMPDNAADYRAMIFVFDSIYNIRPLADAVEVLQ